MVDAELTTHETDVTRRILVGVSGADPSIAALRYALDLCHAGGGKLEALVVDDTRFSLGAILAHGDLLAKLMREAERIAGGESRRVAERVQDMARDANVSLVIHHAEGRAADCIVEASHDTSLVVIGRRDHRTEPTGSLGANAELVVRWNRKPTLVTPPEHRRPKRVVVAYAAKQFGELNLATGACLALAMKIPLVVITVQANPERAQTLLVQAQSELQSRGVEADFVPRVGETAPELIREATATSLFVLGASGRSRLYHMVLGNVTEQVMRGASGPVLLSGRMVVKASC